MKEGSSSSLFRNFDLGFFLHAQANVSFSIWLVHRNFNLGYYTFTAAYVDLESSRGSLSLEQYHLLIHNLVLKIPPKNWVKDHFYIVTIFLHL